MEPFNMIQQSITKHQLCVNHPDHYYNSLVSNNTISHWNNYFMEDRYRLYTKGTVRLDNLCRVYDNPLYKQLNTDEAWFVLSGLIILFQVFGDGNHRTARFLYNKFTGKYFDFDRVHDIFTVDAEITNPMSVNLIAQYIQKVLNIYRGVIN
jgi:hypothetical protein